MSPLETVVACFPLSLYLLAIGLIPFRRRPLVLSGGSDTFYLLLGLLGFFLVGPVKLFLPMDALAVWGAKAYLLVGVLYFLIAIMICGALRQRIMIYNIHDREFITFFQRYFPAESGPLSTAQNASQRQSVSEQPVDSRKNGSGCENADESENTQKIEKQREHGNADTLSALFDGGAKSLGNIVSIPRWNIQFHVDVQPWNRCVVLKSTNREVNLPGWFSCENALKNHFRHHETPISAGRCFFFTAASVFVVALIFYTWFRFPQISRELAVLLA